MYIYIRSMSESQSRIYDRLTTASRQINLHIIKLLLYPNSDSVNHWKHEIWSFLYEVDKLKGKNKFPKASFIQKSLSTHNDMIKEYISLVTHIEENLTPVDISTDDVKSAIESYYSWISQELSAKGVVYPNEVYDKLNEILK